MIVNNFENPKRWFCPFSLNLQVKFWGPITNKVYIGNIQAAGYRKMTSKKFLFAPVENAILISENIKFGTTKSANKINAT